jgi:hypothetical protein
MSLLLASGGGAVTHDATGALVGSGSAVNGTANRTRAHATTGALIGPGSTVAGSSARFRAFATSGALVGAGSIIVGAAELIQQQPQGGGGSGKAKAGVRNRNRDPGRGWANERAQLEQSLIDFEQRQRLNDIAQTLEDSERPQARRIARKLADYTGEAAQVESLRRELAKLELAQRERVAGEQLQAQREADLQAAAQELRAILREDEEVVEIMGMLQDLERNQVLGVLGLTIH